MAMIVLCIFSLGATSMRAYVYLPQDHLKHIAKFYKNKNVRLQGVIDSDIKKRTMFRGRKTSFELEVKYLETQWGWKKKSGRILVNVFREADVTYGDFILLDGKLYPPFSFANSTFSYQDYLSRKRIHLILSVKKGGHLEVLASGQGSFWVGQSLKIKNRLRKILDDTLSKNEAALMKAILLGDRTDIPQPINDLFIHTGTAHILAISGQNIAIIAALIFLLIKIIPIGRISQYFFTILFLIFYAFLTGGQPSVVRATIMAIVFLLSFILERQTEPLNTLALAALLILIINPMNLFDVGFQMSFTSVIAIIIFYPKIINLFPQESPLLLCKPIWWLIQSFVVSMVAWLGVAGFIAYYFHIVTPIALLANLFIVPFMGIIMGLGLGLLMMGIGMPVFSLLFATCLKVMINAMIMCAYLFDRFPWAYFYLTDVKVWSIVGYYLVMGMVFLLFANGPRIRLRKLKQISEI